MLTEVKNKIINYIDENKQEILDMATFIFDNPELGLKEFKAVDKITTYLEKNGFNVERGICKIETAFRATYKSKNYKNGVRVGLLCEYDALEGLGHACGHHMQGPSIILAANTIKNVLQDEDFEIVVYGTPAEETIGCKVQMIKEGAFQDIDIALMMHGSPTTTTDVKSMALSNFDIIFHGTPSHAALTPEKGRSALDGLILLFNGVEFLREHVKEDTRMHYSITESTGPANVVPKLAKAKFSLRSYDRKYLDEVIERFKKIVQGAALMTETEVEIIETKSLDSKIPVISLNNLLMENAKLVNAPRISPPREKTGSTDFGSVMYRVPGSCIRLAFVPVGSSSHSQAFLDCAKTDEGYNAIILASKILALSSYDIISNKEIYNEIKNEFESKKKK